MLSQQWRMSLSLHPQLVEGAPAPAATAMVKARIEKAARGASAQVLTGPRHRHLVAVEAAAVAVFRSPPPLSLALPEACLRTVNLSCSAVQLRRRSGRCSTLRRVAISNIYFILFTLKCEFVVR